MSLFDTLCAVRPVRDHIWRTPILHPTLAWCSVRLRCTFRLLCRQCCRQPVYEAVPVPHVTAVAVGADPLRLLVAPLSVIGEDVCHVRYFRIANPAGSAGRFICPVPARRGRLCHWGGPLVACRFVSRRARLAPARRHPLTMRAASSWLDMASSRYDGEQSEQRRRESNPHLRFWRPSFYRLNYANV